MTDFLRTLFGVSMTGGIFILAAILVRAGMKSRMPKHFLIFLWTAVLAHLLLLVGVPSPTSIYNYITFQRPSVLEREEASLRERSDFQRPSVLEREEASLRERSDPVGNAVVNHSPVPRQGDPANPTGWTAMLPVVWLAGMGILGTGFALCYWTTRKRFDDAILLKGDPAVERWLRDRRRSVRVYVSDRTTTPLSYGLLRPRIILPLDFARDNAARVESVLEHEYVHGSHYHNVMKSLVCVAVIAHWFNPVVWLFWLLFNHDLESACDEQALRGIGTHRKAEYAHSLVAVAERVVTPLPLVSAFNARNLRERIVDVMGFKRTSGYWLIPEVLLVALLFAVFGTTPASGGKYTPSSDIAYETEATATTAIPPEFSEWTYPEGADASAVALSISRGGRVVKNEVERKNGRQIVEFKILSGTFEYTIKLDTIARTMVGYERKEKRDSLVAAEYARFIPMPQAGRLAVDAVGGGEATGVELKRTKSGGVLYEVNVLYRSREYEVKLDALDGRVVEVDD